MRLPIEPAWAVRLTTSDAAILTNIRMETTWYVHFEADTFLLAGPQPTSKNAIHKSEVNQVWPQEIERLPAVERYTVTKTRQLVPVGRQLPIAELPTEAWFPVSQTVSLTLPVAKYPRLLATRQSLVWARSTLPQPIRGLILDAQIWRQFVTHAAQVRWVHSRFALDDSGRALVIGDDLPSLDGIALWECQRLLLPAGWTWAPLIRPSSLRHLMKLPARMYAVAHWQGDSPIAGDVMKWHYLDDSCLLHTTRGLVRQAVSAGIGAL